jgi:hypothetical protein
LRVVGEVLLRLDERRRGTTNHSDGYQPTSTPAESAGHQSQAL